MRRRLRVNRSVERRHQKRCGSSLTRNVTERDYQPPIFALDKVVVVATDFVRRKTDSLQFVTVDVRRSSRLKTLLNLAREGQLALQSLALESGLNETRTLHTDSRDPRQ